MDEAKWVIVETYYKRAEYKLTIITGINEMLEFLGEKLRDYSGSDDDEEDDDEDYSSLDDMICRVVEKGNTRVSRQWGWGVREICQV
jgi:hypothetical protein